MCDNCLQVPLGFTNDTVPAGTHLCLIYSNEEERTDSHLKFLLSGLVNGERTACFSDALKEETVRDFFKKNNISYDEQKGKNAVFVSQTNDVYFAGGKFDPDRMINTLTEYYKEAMARGFSAARVIGEMNPRVEKIPGGERLLEYECRVSMLLKKYPITAVCQYDANAFNGATIMEILKVHPQMIINGTVVQNPFFIQPEVYLEELKN